MKGQYVLEVTSGTFQRDVLAKSRVVPVVVDFWAPWCSPCLTLGPILEKVIGEYGGNLVLAKVNVDSCRDIAERYAVRSIPAVKLFVDGRAAAGFTGAIPEAEVREFLRGALPSGAENLVSRAEELREKGSLQEAESLARKALQDFPENQPALEIVATAAMAAGRVDEALDLVNRMESPSKDMEFLTEGAQFWRMCAEAAAEGKKLGAPPEELDGKMAYAACLASRGEFAQALDSLLQVVEADKSFRNGLAKKAMVSIFVVMGLSSPLVKEYQSRLARLLF